MKAKIVTNVLFYELFMIYNEIANKREIWQQILYLNKLLHFI